MRRLVALLAAALLLAVGQQALAVGTYDVSTPAELQAALDVATGGDTIRLADQDWPALQIEGRYAEPVVVSGPARLTGVVTVAGSSRLELRDLMVDGGQLVLAADSSDLSVHGMEFTRCAGICVQLGRVDEANVTGVLIEGSSFHDSSDHFIGQAGNDIRIEGNTFDRAKDPACGAKNCPEHIRIRGGGPWTIVGNRFGEAEIDGPHIRIWNAFRPTIHDVRVASNVFYSPTVKGSAGVDIEGSVVGREEGRPQRIAVVNNTILVDSNAVGLGSSWGEQQVPGAPPPLVANNVMRFEGADQCARGEFVSNVSATVRGDCPNLDVGPLNLDGSLAPTARSLLIIGRAAPAYAPETDYRGLPRALAPDRGAIELQPLIPVLRKVYPKKAVAVEWLTADFCQTLPCDTVRFIVEDADGNRLTSFLTLNDGNAYTTYPADFVGVRRFRVATPDEQIMSAPWIVTI